MKATSDYRYRTEFKTADSIGLREGKCYGIDIGYGQVKLMTSEGYAVFPAFAREITGQTWESLTEVPDSTIVLTDHRTHREWLIGEAVINDADARKDTGATYDFLLSIDRYGTDAYRALCMASIALCEYSTRDIEAEDDKVIVTTGLPTNQTENNQQNRVEDIRAAFAQSYDVTIRVGSRKPYRAKRTILPSNVQVMRQPMGTVFSLCYTRQGTASELKKKLMSNTNSVLVMDCGTKTVILTGIRGGRVRHLGTLDNYGARAIFDVVTEKIREKTLVSLSPIALQGALLSGEVTTKVKEGRRIYTKNIGFADELGQAVEEAYTMVFDYLYNTVDIETYDYLIVTGGTSAAWKDMIDESFGGIQGLKIVYGDCVYDGAYHPNYGIIPMDVANVRGYYIFTAAQSSQKRENK